MMYNKYEIIAKERGYTITKDGIVYNKQNKTVGYINNKNYKDFSFRVNKKVIHVPFHRFQAYIKYGDLIYKENIVVRHLDGNSLNNSWENIVIGTQSDNMMDIPKEKRIQKSSNANKKYSDSLVLEIKKDREKGMNYKEIMLKYNISSKGTLSYIINNR